MTYLEFLIREAIRIRKVQGHGFHPVVKEIAGLYEDSDVGQLVSEALRDAFFPLSLFGKHHVHNSGSKGHRRAIRAGRDLALFSRMFLRIRKDIVRYFGNGNVTVMDLDGDSFQEVSVVQWCTLCGECCQLPGTIPDPPAPIKYPGYWYAYIAGDGLLIQKFCPFLFELPLTGIFFCAIHKVKPLTCLTYEKEECQKNHPGLAENRQEMPDWH